MGRNNSPMNRLINTLDVRLSGPASENTLCLGCQDEAARGRLFRQKEFDLEYALESLRISERTDEQHKQLATEEQDVPVNTIRKDHQAKQCRLPTSQKQTTNKD